MTFLFNQSLFFALIGSVLLHLGLVLSPSFIKGAEISQQPGQPQLRISLAKRQPLAQPVVESLKPEVVTAEKTAEEVPEAIEPVMLQPEPEPVITSSQPAEKKVAKEAPQETVVKKEPKSENPVEPEVKPEPVAKPKTESKSEPQSQSPPASPAAPAEGQQETTQKTAGADYIDAKQAWLAELQERINRNRRYPRKALRRGLESEVQIKAMINVDGSLASAEVLSGNKNFHSSSLKTLSRSLPLPPPEGTLQPIEVTFSIRYTID